MADSPLEKILDVTPGEPPQVVISYDVQRHIIYRRDAAELGDFVAELAEVSARGPFQ